MSRYRMIQFADTFPGHIVERGIEDLVIEDLARKYPQARPVEDRARPTLPCRGPYFTLGGPTFQGAPVAELDLDGAIFSVEAAHARAAMRAIHTAPDRGGWRKLHAAFAPQCLPDRDLKKIYAWLDANVDRLEREDDAALALHEEQHGSLLLPRRS